MSKIIELKTYQILPVEFIKNNNGLIIYHSVGSGKTITALIGMQQFGKDIIIVGPKSSKKIFEDEILRLKLDREKFQIFTYQKIKNILQDNIEFFVDKCVIIDEAHHLRNETRDNIFIVSALFLSFKIFLLTATPIINYLNDISVLVNIVKKKNVFPTERNLFNFFYFDEERLEINNEHLLKEKLQNCISYYEKADDKNYPKAIIINKFVEMNDEQIEEYKRFIKKIIYEDKIPKEKDFDLMNIVFDKLKNRKKNAFLTSTRQISNTVNGKINSPKFDEIYNEIIKSDFPIVIYSNFLKNGIYPIASLLDKNNIMTQVITGNSTNEKINKIVNDYNNGKIQVLLLSSAGSESLNLKNTRQLHIVENHWNEPKINQVIGRVIRYKSHNDLPANERKVEVFKWISVFPKNYRTKTADEYLLELSNKKTQILEQFKKIIIESSIEHTFNDQNGGYYKKYLKYKQKYLKLKTNY